MDQPKFHSRYDEKDAGRSTSPPRGRYQRLETARPRSSDLLAELLDEISRGSNSKQKGMLSAVVIRKGEEPLPGPGFFKLARELGKAVDSSPDLEEKLAFHATELKLVHDAYA